MRTTLSTKVTLQFDRPSTLKGSNFLNISLAIDEINTLLLSKGFDFCIGPQLIWENKSFSSEEIID